jgi:endonuclease/exonuclease/phosphatase family metal-dependent hydrolase
MREISLKAMSWNLYAGGDVSRVINADPVILPARMAGLWAMVQRTDFRSRARVIADQICSAAPDVVGLQEVLRWSTIQRRPLGDGGPVERVECDFLTVLVEELRARGEDYFAAVRTFGVDVAIPMENGPDVRLQDSVAILLRAHKGSEWTWEKPRQGRFGANLTVKLDGEPFVIARGWNSVDLRQGDGVVRVINTHLEYFDPAVQPAQVQEILDGPASVPGPLIWMGDFNCTVESPTRTWQRLQALGYRDVWNAAENGPGLTSSQAEDLANSTPAEYERIDWILCRGEVRVRAAGLVGNDVRTPEGLWPSDHFGVVASLAVTLDVSRPRAAGTAA